MNRIPQYYDNQSLPPIEICDNTILICDLEIVSRDAVNYLQRLPEAEYEQACIRAFEVGIFCLERTQTSQDTEFVKRQIESLMAEVNRAVTAIPKAVQKELVTKIGTAEGQVLAPINAQINLASTVLTSRLNDVKTLLSKDIDPSKESSVLGSILKNLKTFLDPKRSDSIQGIFTTTIESVTAENGTLAKVIKTVVSESIKPLTAEVDKLAQQFREREVAESVLQQTIAKGTTYEESVVAELQNWSKFSNAEVYYVGNDKESGDIVIKLTPNSLIPTPISIVIEVRDRESQRWGRQRIARQLTQAMAQRQTNAAIFLSRSRDGLAQEIGNWAVGECENGQWVATSHEMLTVAIQFLIIRQQLASQQNYSSQLDCGAIEAQIQRIETALDCITKINTYLTNLRTNADAIQTQAKALKAEIRSALESIQEAIRVVSDEGK
ncbi:hypothetical protein NDI44_22885 [Trichocoleus sp. DQ-A3]|uniref:hypothetical protein n=1 Tax=Cyanophyceae TaxID=3028117 RepID=UPI0016845C45|nr:hypothetical protein [Coleofasciculus sp. FACHB-125]MBD1903376.1 hypothetical protein [Coleofasciculus sp. FACHB-125]